MKKKILFTLCGRAGSKGIKSKNVRFFCGIPLVYYSLSALELYLQSDSAEYEYSIALSTDSPELMEQVRNYTSLHVEMISRSDELSGDLVGKKDVILDCLIQMEDKERCKYDAVVDLDLTSPLRTKTDIKNLIEKHFATDADITYSVTPARRNPYFNQVLQVEKGYRKVIVSEFTARQQAPEVFDMNASLYAYNPSFLKNGGGFEDGYYEVIQMYDTAVLDLDNENDFELMQVIARYLFEKNKDFGEVFENARRV
ncbi:acylneuraminate cytidylyltransferase family protein [Butyrivibrio sp. AE2032]|uniref:acylneuraminate cytidylyltransferase family protein n=1 Tax=Butyrivibrio sp. AE2032 TaxID=1458463 RepID=UPI000557B704|nr:acylneuraminate cytidylyltransferase family protein [Butyrivibrio sp. AE2032]